MINIAILSHDDLDGAACTTAMRIAADTNPNYNIVYSENIAIPSLTEGLTNLLEFCKTSKANLVLVTDLALSDEQMDIFNKICDETGDDTCYHVDHHIGSDGPYCSIGKCGVENLIDFLTQKLEFKPTPEFLKIITRVGNWDCHRFTGNDDPAISLNTAYYAFGQDWLYEYMGEAMLHENIEFSKDVERYIELRSKIKKRKIETLTELAPKALHKVNLCGHSCLIMSNPGGEYVSELGEILATKYDSIIGFVDPNTGTMSLRSVGDVDVSELAIALGGGGHKNAAGCKVDRVVLLKIMMSAYLDEVKYSIEDRYDNVYTICDGVLETALIKSDKAIIPKEVVEIGQCVFSNCYDLESIEIPETVTKIGQDAFRHCESLKNIDIPNSVTEIGPEAFAHCNCLSSIVIPENITEIPIGAFSYCKRLKSITIPDKVTAIGPRAFMGCGSLETIDLPKELETLGWSAFSGCRKLQKIVIPSKVKMIDSWTFDRCKALTSITLPEGLKELGFRSFSWCSNLTTITIPDSVEYIGSKVFMYCSKLISCIIPNGVEVINEEAFSGCEHLQTVDIPDTVEYIAKYAFIGCDNLSEDTKNRIAEIQARHNKNTEV